VSYVVNMVMGGGSSINPNKAVIRVLAPTGSTITFSKNGVVAKTLSPSRGFPNSADNTLSYWYCSIDSSAYGTFDVSATVAGATETASVTVGGAYQYEVYIDFA